MAIPQEILNVERPKNTRVKKSGNRFLVIKRTCKRVNGKNLPVELGTIGEIVDLKYVEIRKEPRGKRSVDIKDYGIFKLFNDASMDIFKKLMEIFEPSIAKRIYAIALLRAIDPDIKNRDLSFAYETSYLSEVYPGLALSENTISKLLQNIGMEYRYIHKFICDRVKQFEGNTQVIDGTLIDNNSTENSFSEFSRKSKTKGSKDLTLVYSFDIESEEPIGMKTYVGNMLDSTSINDFLTSYSVKNSLIVLDKGFYSKKNIKEFKDKENLSFIIPLKYDSKLIKENKMYEQINNHLKGYEDDVVMYKKTKVNDDTFLYAYKSMKDCYAQSLGYVLGKEKSNKFDSEAYVEKENTFGVIVFESNKDMNPLEVYLAYSRRWEIETMFQMMKGIIDLDKVNVHNDYSVISTEFINYISVIMAQKVKKLIKNTKITVSNKERMLSEVYSYKQIMKYLSKIKKIKLSDSDKWINCTTLKYIGELASALGI